MERIVLMIAGAVVAVAIFAVIVFSFNRTLDAFGCSMEYTPHTQRLRC